MLQRKGRFLSGLNLTFILMGCLGFLHQFATNCAFQEVDAYGFNTQALLNRHCVECQHFKRGDYIADNSCSRICKDEIKVVDLISE